MNQSPRPDMQSGTEPETDERTGDLPEAEPADGASLAARLYASKHVHRLVPAPMALGLVASLGPAARQLRNPAERRDAERFMHDLLLHTPRADEAGALAKEWLKEKSRVRELFWRPWLLKQSRVHDAQHWDAAHAAGRGCVIVMGHLGAMWATAPILTLHGYDFYLVASPHYWEALPPGYRGLVLRHRRREYGEKFLGDKSRVIPADADPTQLIQLLQAGKTVAIAFDVPGWAATPFLGRKVALSGGPATLAFKTKAAVLPVVAERHGSRFDLRMLPPLDPAGYRDLPSLRVAIAQKFEALVLSRPEIVELPWYPSPLLTETPPPRPTAAPQAG